jgi:predicted nucleic acid-binding Zn ribbon protein
MQLLRCLKPGCDCPRCNLVEFQRAVSEHLVTAGAGDRADHLRKSWEKPAPRRKRPRDE